MNQEEQDANPTGSVSQAEPSSSSEVTSQVESVPTQAGEKPVAEETKSSDIPFHEHPRFKELVDEKNQQKMEAEMLRREVETLKRQASGNSEASQRQSVFESYVNDLVDQGMDRAAAQRFATKQFEAMQAVAQHNVAPLAQNQQQLSLSQAMESFKQNHSDYETYRTKMASILSQMTPEKREWIMSNLSDGIENLYLKAKELSSKDIEKQNIEKGRDEAYKKKIEKASISSSVSSSPNLPDLDSFEKELSKIEDPEEYAKKKKELDKKEAQLLGVIYRG